MIDKENITQLLNKLDEALVKKSLHRQITIFGSGALILQGVASSHRATVDIDMVEPDIDMELQLLCAEVGEEYDLDLTWMNSSGNIFSRHFPEGWRTRVIQVYSGRALHVFSLSRKDLIATKFYAACTRALQSDFNDLEDLAPTKSEVEFAYSWVSTKNEYSDIKERIEAVYKKVLSLGNKSEK